MREDLPYIKTSKIERVHKFPPHVSPRAFHVAIMGLLLTSCTAPKPRYDISVVNPTEEDLYLNSESLYYSMLVSPQEVSMEEEGAYETVETNETTQFHTLVNSLISNPRYSDDIIGLFERRKNQSLEYTAARVRARLEMAYCQTEPMHYKPLHEQWSEYSQRKYHQMMRSRCDILVQSHVEIRLLDSHQILQIPKNFQELTLVDQFSLLSRRLDQIEYAYLLSTLQEPPMDDNQREVMNNWESLQFQTERQLQNTLYMMIMAKQLPKRRPGLVPHR